MLTAIDVYRPHPEDFELQPFQDRVLEVVRLFEDAPVVRLRIRGTIAAGKPIEAVPDDETVEVRGPLHAARRHRAALRHYLCPALNRVSGDAFEIARIVTPLLAGLKLSGHAPADVDLDPWLFAGVSLLVARMGVAAFCAEDEKDDEEHVAEQGSGDGPTEPPPDGGQHRHEPPPVEHRRDEGRPRRRTHKERGVRQAHAE